MPPLDHSLGHDGVDSDGRKHESKPGQDTENDCHPARIAGHPGQVILHRVHFIDRRFLSNRAISRRTSFAIAAGASGVRMVMMMTLGHWRNDR